MAARRAVPLAARLCAAGSATGGGVRLLGGGQGLTSHGAALISSRVPPSSAAEAAGNALARYYSSAKDAKFFSYGPRTSSTGHEGRFGCNYARGSSCFCCGGEEGEFHVHRDALTPFCFCSSMEGKHPRPVGFPTVIYPQNVKEEMEQEKWDRLFARLERLLEKKEGAEAERLDKFVARLDELDDQEFAALMTNKFKIRYKILKDDEKSDRFSNWWEKEPPGHMMKICPQYWEVKLERALAEQKKEYDKFLAAQKAHYEGMVSELEKRFDQKISECNEEIKKADTKAQLLVQNMRIQNVQYTVLKCIAGVITFAGGATLTYFKLKEHVGGLEVVKKLRDWLDSSD